MHYFKLSSLGKLILVLALQVLMPEKKRTEIIDSVCLFACFFPGFKFRVYEGQLVRRLPFNTELTSSKFNALVQNKLLTSGEARTQERKLSETQLRARLRALEKKMALQKSNWDPRLPVIFAITPTYRRFLQKAELTRTAQTLKHVKNLHWIVVEDSHERTNLVKRFLSNSGLNYTHLNTRTPVEMRRGRNKPRWTKSRGVEQRNTGIEWLRENINPNLTKGVVYFADDDNTYDIRLFEEVSVPIANGNSMRSV